MNGCAADRCGGGFPKVTQTDLCMCLKQVVRPAFQKTRISVRDFQIDYEMFSETLPDESFPPRQRLVDARSLGTPTAASRR